MTKLNFEWDPGKARQNQRKHEVSFTNAATIFLDPLMLSAYDETHSESEERWITLGQSVRGELLTVVHTWQEISATEVEVRIISARRATGRERQRYESKS